MTHTIEDTEFQLAAIDEVRPCGGGWLVDHGGWTLFCTNKECTVAPQVGETMVMFGRGAGYTVRGIEIGGRVYRYKTKERDDAEDAARCAEVERERAIDNAAMLVREAAVSESGEKYAWRDGMGEISGFGGGYEEACRKMLRAGLRWLDDNPQAVPRFKGNSAIFGVISEDNGDAKLLSDVVTKAVDDCTGAMHHAVIRTCLWIRKNGWDAYCTAMKSQKETP